MHESDFFSRISVGVFVQYFITIVRLYNEPHIYMVDRKFVFHNVK